LTSSRPAPQPATSGAFTPPSDIQAGENVLELFRVFGPSYRWFVTLTAMLGSFITLLTGTIINVAIPDIMGALGMTAEKAQWLSTGFLAATTVTMLLNAWAVERLGMSRAYTLSLLVFLAGSLLGGIANNGDLVILARVIQGAGSGMMAPMSMLIIFQVFPPHRRGTAMGIFSVGVVLAPALGPVIGGTLVDALSWRYVFFIAIPLSLIAIPMAMAFMPRREPHAGHPDFDWLGVALLTIFLVTILTALSNAPSDGWGANNIAVLFFSAAASGIAFLWWQIVTPHPILAVRLFANIRFLAAAIVTFTIGVGLFGSTYLLPLFLQTAQSMTPTDSGMLLLPAGLAMAVFFPIAGRMADSISARRLIVFGVALFALSSFLLARVDMNTPFFDIAFWTLLGRIGLSFIFPVLNAAALRPLPWEDLAHGSGIVNFLRQLGGAFGVNLLAIFHQRRTSFFSQSLDSTQTPGNETSAVVVEQLTPLLAQAGVSSGERIPLAYGYLSSMVDGQALMLGYRDAFLAVAVVFFLTLIPALFLDARKPDATFGPST